MSKVWQWIELGIQAFVLFLSGTGWYIASVHIGYGWLLSLHGHRVFGGLYLLFVNALILTSVAFYMYLCSGRRTHSVARYPLPDRASLVEPYPCFDTQGGFRLCTKGSCSSQWAPPRSHHCSTCGVCRLEFDHHCPWVGNCVTIARLKLFTVFLLTFALTFLVAIAPVGSVQLSHVKTAIRASQKHPLTRQYWWDWPGSWMVICGPPGRWIVGAILGFWLLQAERDPNAPGYPGQLIEEPHFRVVAVVFVFLALSMFALFLVGMTVHTAILQGTTTYESLGISGRKRTDLICVPTQERHEPSDSSLAASESTPMREQGVVFPPEPNERLYDLGILANFKRFWQMPLFPLPSPDEFRWSKLNPNMVQRMRRAALEAIRRETEEAGNR